jgi:signal transduction histidine kinase
LIGIDDSWNEISNQRSASYNDIPAGDYTFEVIAANNNGVWSEQPAAASITVQPYFYEQPWFFILVLALITAGYFGSTQIRYRYLLNKQRKLETIIQEQTAELRQERNDLQVKNQIIRRQATELEESNKTKDKFFSIIAHDLRNPFQAILGFTELSLMDADDSTSSELTENLQNIKSSAKQLLELVENLLKWASLQTGKIKLAPEWINLSDLLKQTQKLLEHVGNQKEISITVSAPEQARILADQNMLQTVLLNLVSNALKFTESGGKVELLLRKMDDHYLISVKDNGIGMPKKIAENLLRLDSNTSRPGTDNEKGSGLGLLICKEMITLHNGSISVESEEKTGTEFILKLPIKAFSEAQKN